MEAAQGDKGLGGSSRSAAPSLKQHSSSQPQQLTTGSDQQPTRRLTLALLYKQRTRDQYQRFAGGARIDLTVEWVPLRSALRHLGGAGAGLSFYVLRWLRFLTVTCKCYCGVLMSMGWGLQRV